MINQIWSKLKTLERFLKLNEFMSLKSLYFLKRMKRYKLGQVKTKYGLIEYVDAPTFLAGFYEIFIDKIYNVKECLQKKPVVIDCGANIGLSAIYFSETYGAEVHAFEADPSISELLKRNVDRACPSGRVKVVSKAVWIDDEGVDFDVEGGYSGQIHQHGHELVKESIKVPSIGLREIISGMDHIDFLKLDIEGAENKTLLECEGLLKNINYIFIEWHSNSSEPQLLGEILNLLKKEGFRYHIKDAFTSDYPFLKVEEMCGMDLQLNIFALK